MSSQLLSAIMCNQLRIPFTAVFDDPLLRGKVNVYNSKAFRKPIRPFKIVEQRPQKITTHVNAFRDGASQFLQMRTEIIDAARIVNVTIGTRLVAKRRAVLSDVDGRQRGFALEPKQHS